MPLRFPLGASAIVALLANVTPLLAQSGSPAGGPSAITASATSPPTDRANPPTAMNGYCPVSILESRRWVKGDPQFAVVLDGKLYLFSGQEQKDRYLRNPVKYTPALGGDCIVCAVKGIARHPGSINFTAIHNERLFMFPGEREKEEFMREPDEYADKDIAYEGKCIVSQVDLGRDVQGQQEFGTIYGGIRFLFTNLDHRKKFLADPGKYFQSQ